MGHEAPYKLIKPPTCAWFNSQRQAHEILTALAMACSACTA